MDQATPIDTNEIVVTASRSPEEAAQTPASVTIIDQARIERLGEPQISGFLRLVPSAAVSTSGPMGSITEVRIRGAEANHTLLFIDGIPANPPAESNTPRFELLNPDIASRIEVVRGPQSALWGSEAIGGVILVASRADATPTAFVEAGHFAFGLAGRSDYDGYDPVTFNRADTLDYTRNQLSAGRLLASYDPRGAWKASA